MYTVFRFELMATVDRMMRAIIVTATLLSLSAAAVADNGSGRWQFRLTPYLWLPAIGGTLNCNSPPAGGAPEFLVGPIDWLDLLNYGLLIAGTVRKGNISLFSDFIYLSMTSKNDGRVVSVEDSKSVPGTPVQIPIDADLNLNTRTDLDGMLFTIAGGYRRYNNGRGMSRQPMGGTQGTRRRRGTITTAR